MDTFPTNEDHGIVDRVARDRAPQAKRWWARPRARANTNALIANTQIY